MKTPNYDLDYGEDPAQWARSREEAERNRAVYLKRKGHPLYQTDLKPDCERTKE